MLKRLITAALFTSAMALMACATASRLDVLHAPPAGVFRVLGMVSGSGPNQASAMDHMKSQAAGLGANALLMIGSRRAGNTVIVRAKALYVKPVAKE
jgi:hypothetical protein